MRRPAVDVVVPFKGERDALAELTSRLRALRLRDGDTVVVVDNTPGHEPPPALNGVALLHAAARTSPGYARNRGAERGANEWIVFVDADTEPAADLLDRYFEPPPAPETALLAGGVRDEQVPRDAPGPARYAYLMQTMSQNRTLRHGNWSFVQSSNVAVRRSAFEAVGGFHETIAAAEDADLTYRLRELGGAIERRESALAVHRSRESIREFVSRAALYGGGAAWLDHRYPGSWPARRLPGLMWWALRWALARTAQALRSRDRDQLILAVFDPLYWLSFELGRWRSVELAPRDARR